MVNIDLLRFKLGCYLFSIFSLEKNDLKRADLKTLIQHDFIKMNAMGDSDYEFIKDVVNELNG
jgi:hypothetical protein